MYPIDKVSSTEKYYIDNMIEQYACDNKDIFNTSYAGTDRILREWNSKKEDLFNIFGDELILSKTCRVGSSYDDKAYNMNNFLSSSNFRLAYIDKIVNMYYNYNDIDGFFDTKADFSCNYESYICLRSLVSNPKYLITNKYEDSDIVFTYKGHKHTIQRGSKTLKALGKLAKMFGLNKYFEKFKDEHSKILTDKEEEVEICLSIHPLDYITMSENDCSWTSCMNWHNNGCYRLGTVEMMNSPMVVVGYVRYPEDMDRKDRNGNTIIKWNNKKWRSLFVVNNDIICSIKAYPYADPTLSKTFVYWLRELCNKYYSIEKYGDVMTGNPYSAIQHPVYNDINFHINPDANYMYNDFNSSLEIEYSLGNLSEDEIKSSPNYYKDGNFYRIIFNYSGYSECMICGALDMEVREENCLTCEDCVPVNFCDYCGYVVHDDNMYIVDDQIICRDCYNNEEVVVECDITGEFHLRQNCDIYKIMTMDGVYSNSYNLVIYNANEELDTLSEYFKGYRTIKNLGWWGARDQLVVCAEDATPKGLEFLRRAMRLDTAEQIFMGKGIDTFFSEFSTEDCPSRYEYPEFLLDWYTGEILEDND